MTVPPSVPKWFASQYPSLELAPQWLEECHTFLQENFQLTAPVLLKKIESQLLLSDLALSTIHHAGLFPVYDDERTEVLFQDAKGAGVLVQVLEILEIGRPALELLKLHREKVEDRKIFREQGRTVRRAVAAVDPTQGTGTNNNDDNPDMNNAEEAQNIGKGFPRAMLRLRVSDGFNEYVAIETKRISGLSLDDTALGCKLMLKKVRCQRGVLMLEETCCTVKGGSIPDLENDRDALLESWLEARIRGEDDLVTRPLQRHDLANGRGSSASRATTAARNLPQPASQPAPVGSLSNRTGSNRIASNGTSTTASALRSAATAPKPAVQRIPEEEDFDFDDDVFDDDEEALAALQEAELSASNARTQAARASASAASSANSRQPSLPITGNSRAATNPQSSNRAPSRPAIQSRASQVIDIDDSSDDDDDDAQVALMLLSDSSQPGADYGGSARSPAANASRGRTGQPIELD
ncbi:hypothetical protein P389DRAFT_198857 [Cystobasidium minutum MCA 4210]|uniref:uncharacterized protein n=1 Tax=Cystobasidium minutum MCA 4210 TaxID=1397322 RepID=UPI0034CF0737|eukprot:jgi/Rhomi1/198857/gm1.7071_g